MLINTACLTSIYETNIDIDMILKHSIVPLSFITWYRYN